MSIVDSITNAIDEIEVSIIFLAVTFFFFLGGGVGGGGGGRL